MRFKLWMGLDKDKGAENYKDVCYVMGDFGTREAAKDEEKEHLTACSL